MGATNASGKEMQGHRRVRREVPRSHVVKFSLTDEEFEAVRSAAHRVGLSKGAYAAEATLAAARRVEPPHAAPLREALAELVRAAGQVRRIGVNLNQAVAALNATGQYSDALAGYAAACARRVERLDAVAECIRRQLGTTRR